MAERADERGFSLLEVMVAIAILGLSLTVILSAQAGLTASNRSAANMGVAIAAGRCKMTELEERLLRLGYPLLDDIDTDTPCCEGTDWPGVRCDTRIEKSELPNLASSALGDGGAPPLAGPLASLAAAASAAGSSPALSASSVPSGVPGPGDLAGVSLDGGLQALGGAVQQQLTGTGGTGGMLQALMALVYPSLKPMMEASIRRVTVTVRWKEGPVAKELPLVQYVTSPQRGGFMAGVVPGAPSAAASGSAAPAAPPVGVTP